MEVKKVNTDIVRVIIEKYLPGTKDNHGEIIEIDSFIELWKDVERPVLSEIEDHGRDPQPLHLLPLSPSADSPGLPLQ